MTDLQRLMLDLWQSATHALGASVLIAGAAIAFVYCWCTAADWVSCQGKWTRCTKCGERTKRTER